jgi:hypothetical protein
MVSDGGGLGSVEFYVDSARKEYVQNGNKIVLLSADDCSLLHTTIKKGMLKGL